MKKSLIAALILCAAMGVAHSQQVVVTASGEKTVSGWQYGGALSFRTKNQWNFGGFYQQDFLTKPEKDSQPNNFYGLTMNIPVAKCEKLVFCFNTRLGLANRHFIVLVPGLETEVNLSERFSFSALMSVRMSYPSAALKLNVKL